MTGEANRQLNSLVELGQGGLMFVELGFEGVVGPAETDADARTTVNDPAAWPPQNNSAGSKNPAIACDNT